jgi:hypothetical protein
LELVDALLGAGDGISFVVLEGETDVGHEIFISLIEVLSSPNKERMEAVYLKAPRAITGKWTAPKDPGALWLAYPSGFEGDQSPRSGRR